MPHLQAVSTASEDLVPFADERETDGQKTRVASAPWKVLLVDDDPEVHQLTRLVLDGYTFEERSLEFLCAHSAREAREIAAREPDIAVAFVDVVMETDDAGLEFVRFLRRELENRLMRIVLRTGQAGMAPERRVVVDFDINDYKDKSELTATKLFTALTTALRGYTDLTLLEESRRKAVEHRKGLEQIVDASRSIFELRSLERFAQGMLMQFESLLGLVMHSLYQPSDGIAAIEEADGFRILAATGEYSAHVDGRIDEHLGAEAWGLIERAVRERRSQFGDGFHVCYVENASGVRNILMVRGNTRDLPEEDRSLIEIFNNNISIAFQNISLKDEIEETQRAIIHTLGEATEARSRETGFHVRRVGEFSRILATRLGLCEEEVQLLSLAAPLHDVGKIAIPDAVLLKPARLTADEYELMKKHTTLGHQMLQTSHRKVLQAAAVIALEHHERFDGTGYPQGLAGMGIDLRARITAIADVFDALCNDRIYRGGWSVERVLGWFEHERGKAFDPELLDVFFECMPEIIDVRRRFRD